MKIGIMGIPFNGDGTRPEIENPAAALREAGWLNLKSRRGDLLFDFGDLEIPVFDGNRDPRTKVLNLKAWKQTSQDTAQRLLSIQAEVDFVIVLGGDCSILLGIVGAFRLADKRVGLVFLDGHTDYRDPAFSSSGEPADFELAIITGKGPPELIGLFGPPPLIQSTDAVVCGYREPDLIGQSSIAHFSAQVFRDTGAVPMAHKTLALLADIDRLWLHFDVDVLDPSLMPVCFPEPNGLSIDETLVFLSTCLHSKKFMGISVACYHPNLDSDLDAASKVVSMLDWTLTSGR